MEVIWMEVYVTPLHQGRHELGLVTAS